jgi:hypothetical protein
MAKIVGPLHSIEARGRVGGLVYNTWRGQSVVAAVGTPVIQHSGAQDSARAISTYLAQKWKTLSSARQAAWREKANRSFRSDWSGTPYRLHGEAAYIRANWHRVAIGEGENDDPYPDNEVRIMAPVVAVWTSSDISVSWDADYYTYWLGLYVQMAGYVAVSPGRAPDITHKKHMAYTLFHSGVVTYTTFDVGLWYLWLRTFSMGPDYPTPWVATQVTVT